MHFHFTLVCHFYVYIYSVDNDVLCVSSDSDIEMVDFEKEAIERAQKRKKFWSKLEKDGMSAINKPLLE